LGLFFVVEYGVSDRGCEILRSFFRACSVDFWMLDQHFEVRIGGAVSGFSMDIGSPIVPLDLYSEGVSLSLWLGPSKFTLCYAPVIFLAEILVAIFLTDFIFLSHSLRAFFFFDVFLLRRFRDL
jgi:hypothetical protein